MSAVLGADKKILADHKGNKYEELAAEHDFVQKSHDLAYVDFPGMDLSASMAKEVILISEEDKLRLIHVWNKFLQTKENKLSKIKTSISSPDYIHALLSYVNRFAIFCLNAPNNKYRNQSSAKEEYIKVMVNKYKKCGDVVKVDKNDIRAAIPLSRIIAHGCGVIRHQNLVNAIIIAHLIHEKKLPPGQVKLYRHENHIRSGDHTVMVYVQDGKIWLFDHNSVSASALIPPFYLIPSSQLSANPKEHSNESRALRYKSFLGEEDYDEMFKRLLPKPTATPVLKPSASLALGPNAAAGSEVSTAAKAPVVAKVSAAEQPKAKVEIDVEIPAKLLPPVVAPKIAAGVAVNPVKLDHVSDKKSGLGPLGPERKVEADYVPADYVSVVAADWGDWTPTAKDWVPVMDSEPEGVACKALSDDEIKDLLARGDDVFVGGGGVEDDSSPAYNADNETAANDEVAAWDVLEDVDLTECYLSDEAPREYDSLMARFIAGEYHVFDGILDDIFNKGRFDGDTSPIHRGTYEEVKVDAESLHEEVARDVSDDNEDPNNNEESSDPLLFGFNHGYRKVQHSSPYSFAHAMHDDRLDEQNEKLRRLLNRDFS